MKVDHTLHVWKSQWKSNISKDLNKIVQTRNDKWRIRMSMHTRSTWTRGKRNDRTNIHKLHFRVLMVRTFKRSFDDLFIIFISTKYQVFFDLSVMWRYYLIATEKTWYFIGIYITERICQTQTYNSHNIMHSRFTISVLIYVVPISAKRAYMYVYERVLRRYYQEGKKKIGSDGTYFELKLTWFFRLKETSLMILGTTLIKQNWNLRHIIDSIRRRELICICEDNMKHGAF